MGVPVRRQTMKLPELGELVGMSNVDPAPLEQRRAFQGKELRLPIAPAGNVGQSRKSGRGRGSAALKGDTVFPTARLSARPYRDYTR